MWSTVLVICAVVFVRLNLVKVSRNIDLALLLGQALPEKVVLKSPAKQIFLFENNLSKSIIYSFKSLSKRGCRFPKTPIIDP